jgi:hypothetical protein
MSQLRNGSADRGRIEGDEQHDGDETDAESAMGPAQHGLLGPGDRGDVGSLRDTGVTRLKGSHGRQRKGHNRL